MASIVCELCGAGTLMKDDGYFVCQECGTRYTLEEARKLLQDNPPNARKAWVAVNGIGTVENLLLRAKEYESSKKYDLAADYYNKVLDIDFANVDARNGLYRIDHVVTGFNLTVDFSKGNRGSVATVFIDGNRSGTISGGEVKKYSLPYGDHQVGVAGGIRKCKDATTIHIHRGARYNMYVSVRGLSFISVVTKA